MANGFGRSFHEGALKGAPLGAAAVEKQLERNAVLAEKQKKREGIAKGLDAWQKTVEDPQVIDAIEALKDAPLDVQNTVLTSGFKTLTGTAGKSDVDKLANAMSLMYGKDPRATIPPKLDTNKPIAETPVDTIPTETDIAPVKLSTGFEEQMKAGTPIKEMLVPSATVQGTKITNVRDMAAEESIKTRINKTVGKLADFAGGVEVERQRNAHNLELVGGIFYDLADNMAAAYEEGSIGDVFKDTETAIRGWLGGDFDIEAGEGLALKGKFAETVLNLFPLMTQQIGKEGSIRLMDTVLKQIRSTLPSGKTSATTAKKFLRNTIQTLYRKQRAISMLLAREGTDVFQALPGETDTEYKSRVDEFVKEINTMSAGIIIPRKSEEYKAMTDMIDAVTSPLDSQIGQESKGISGLEAKRKRLAELQAKAGE